MCVGSRLEIGAEPGRVSPLLLSNGRQTQWRRIYRSRVGFGGREDVHLAETVGLLSDGGLVPLSRVFRGGLVGANPGDVNIIWV